MKKIYKLLVLFSLNSILVTSCVSCSIPYHPTIDPWPPTPPNPVKKDITYYQNEIINLQKNITSIEADLKHLDNNDNKKIPGESISKSGDLKVLEIMLKGDLNKFKAQIDDDNYQILLLQNNNNLPPEAIQTAKKYLNSQLDYLRKEVTLLTDNLVKDLTQTQVIQANNQIVLVTKVLQDL